MKIGMLIKEEKISKTVAQNSPEIEKWLKIIRADGIGPVSFFKMLKKLGSVDNILNASVSQLTKIEGIGNKTAEKIAATRENFDTQNEIKLAKKLGISIINYNDPRYPPALKDIYDPPPVIYVNGDILKNDCLAVAIVGSRRCSRYGAEQASRFAHLLASAGFTIISGLARGIDTAAHRGALSAKHRTIAVQGSGLANVYPQENYKLAQNIAKSGACISELPLTYLPKSENFPARNRIISGLSIAVIVVEASNRSGALITAKTALEQNREVMAIPGQIDSPFSKGTNNLIKQGAKLIDSIEDVTNELGYIGHTIKSHTLKTAQNAENKAQTSLFDYSRLNLSADEKTIIELFDHNPLHIEQIISLSSLPAGKVNASLISLRLKGLIKNLPGNIFKAAKTNS